MSVLIKVSGLVNGEQLDTPKIIKPIFTSGDDNIDCLTLLTQIGFFFKSDTVKGETEQISANPNSIVGMIVGEFRNEKLLCNKHNAQNQPDTYPPETKFSKTYDTINQPTQLHVHKMQKKELKGASDAYDIIKTWLNHDVQLEQDGYTLAVDDGQKITFYADYYYKKNAETEKLEAELFGKPVNDSTEPTAIQCTPSSIDVDNTQAVAEGTYSLKIQVNDKEPQIFTQKSSDNPSNLVTPAKILLRMLQNLENVCVSGSGGEHWIAPPITGSILHNTQESITIGGITKIIAIEKSEPIFYPDFVREEQNHLTLSPANDGNLDLFQYLPHNGQDEIVLHSCALAYFGGE